MRSEASKMAASMRNMWCKTTLQVFAQQSRVRRNICTCHSLQNDAMKSKTMQKLLSRQKDKKIGYMIVKAPNVKTRTGPKPMKMYRNLTAGAQKRLEQIGTIYHEHLAQIVSEGELDVNIEVLKVQVIQDMSSVNVHWAGTDDKEKDDTIQQTLEEKAGYIRHTLHSRNVLGYIPKIVFVKDLAAAKEKKLDEIFERLNLNPSRIPEEYTESCELQESDELHDDESASLNTTGNKFRQDLYGLQHDVLMQKVVNAKLGKPVGPEIVVSEVDPELMTKVARKEYVQKFSKHLKGQKIQKEKDRRIRDYISDHYREREDIETEDYADSIDYNDDIEYHDDPNFEK